MGIELLIRDFIHGNDDPGIKEHSKFGPLASPDERDQFSRFKRLLSHVLGATKVESNALDQQWKLTRGTRPRRGPVPKRGPLRPPLRREKARKT